MKLNQRLNLITVISLGAVVFIFLSLFWSYHEISKTTLSVDLVEEIRIVAFERIMLRDDFLLHAEERAKIQWHSKSETLRRLLDVADQRFTDSSERDLLREVRKDFDATFVSISAFMERYEREKRARTKGLYLTEAESMLISQAFLKAYSHKDSINKLHASIEQKAKRVWEKSIVIVVFFMLSGIMVITLNSMLLSRLLGKRITALSKGIEILGAGDLDYRIDARGDDEFSALALCANEMAGKLKISHTSLESLRHEINERKRVEEELRRSENRFATVFCASPVCISLTRLSDGKFLDINDAFLHLFGYDREQVIGRNPLMLNMWANPDDRARMVETLRKSGRMEDFETTIRTKSGEIRNVIIISEVVDVAGEQYILGLTLDITERKRAEEERRKLEQQLQTTQKLESLGILAAGIAHEIRNPLSGINISLSSIEHVCRHSSGLEPEKMEKIRLLMDHMNAAATKIASIVQRVMDFSKPTPPRMAMADLNEVIAGALRMTSSTLRKRGIAVHADLALDLPTCRVDSGLIEQVFVNLLTNAYQAMEGIEGEKHLEIASVVQDGQIVIRVSDSGPGVPPSIRGKIFDPFFTTRKDGSGIGLSFSHRIIAAHGGTLRVNTSRWGGAEFQIELPTGAREGIPA